jgi:hypothetical protein
MPRSRTRSASRAPHPAHQVLDPPDASILDLLDRLLDKGVMVNGDLTLGLAGVDLIYVRLSALLCASDRVLPATRAPKPRPRRRSKRIGPRS